MSPISRLSNKFVNGVLRQKLKARIYVGMRLVHKCNGLGVMPLSQNLGICTPKLWIRTSKPWDLHSKTLGSALQNPGICTTKLWDQHNKTFGSALQNLGICTPKP